MYVQAVHPLEPLHSILNLVQLRMRLEQLVSAAMVLE